MTYEKRFKEAVRLSDEIGVKKAGAPYYTLTDWRQRA